MDLDVDEINNASLWEYFPFRGSKNFKKIFFSARYLELIEDYLEDNDIEYDLLVGQSRNTTNSTNFGNDFINKAMSGISTSRYISEFNFTLPEYADEDFISIDTEDVLPGSAIHVHARDIFLKSNAPKVRLTVMDLYFAICEAYGADKWYSNISNLTFKSVLLPLTPNEVCYLASISGNIVNNNIIDDNTNIDGNMRDLLERLNSAFKSLDSGKYFVRLYSVSPKNDEGEVPIVTTAEEALKLLTTSPRSYSTLCELAESGIGHGIMIREYVTMNRNYEFRLFVFGGNLRAISQYMCYDVIEEFQDKHLQDLIYKSICTWWNGVCLQFPFKDFVLDIVFISNIINIADYLANIPLNTDYQVLANDIKVIEINSFGPGLLAGSSLYNWKTDYDVMHYSTKPDIRFNSVAV